MGSVVKCTLFWLHVIYIAFDCFHWFLLSGTYNIYILIIWKGSSREKMQTLQKKSFGLVVFFKEGKWNWVTRQIPNRHLSTPELSHYSKSGGNHVAKEEKSITRKPLPAAGPSSPNIRYLWIKQVLKRLLSTTWFLKKSWTTKSLPYLSTYLCIFKIWKGLERSLWNWKSVGELVMGIYI